MVKFALGLLKTNPSPLGTVMTDWALKMADVTTAGTLTTASQGVLPTFVSHGGSVILGIDGDNSNYSWGTFYEGAVVADFPADDTELFYKVDGDIRSRVALIDTRRSPLFLLSGEYDYSCTPEKRWPLPGAFPAARSRS